MNMDEIIKKFINLGLSETKALETIKNQTLTNTLLQVLDEVDDITLNDGTGILLYHLSTKTKPQMNKYISFIVKYIKSKQIDSILRVDKAVEYTLNNITKFEKKEFENYCGIGIVVTPEEIESTIEKIIKENKNEIINKRYCFNTGPLMQQVRTLLPWADGKAIKNEVDVQIFDLLGPKTDIDIYQKSKKIEKLKVKDTTPMDKVVIKKVDEPLNILDVMRKVNFHKPGENFKTDGYVITENTDFLLKEHLKITGGKVRTRFPPEPNGILHIGHAKAININFGYAAAHNGSCYLRFDDTNPEKEEGKYFESIIDMVNWLGYKPDKITYSSDYFDQLYEWAVQLIKLDLAYVCHQTADEMKGFNSPPSPWRNRSIAENLQLFEDMKNGKIDEGAATLRMKITLEEGKLDPVAYRIRFIPHHRTGNKWCIYPTYDYTHCLCDSIEHITHSLCTKEFQSRRSSYYWLCNALNIYCPVQWEYGRLNINYTVVSKRKIAKLIEQNIVKDWDDPRLFTLTALRRRGFPPEAINNFCAQLGITGAQSTVDPIMLESYVRDYLNNTALRRMVVLRPLKVVIMNFPYPIPISINVPDFPSKSNTDTHSVVFSDIIYIERDDFMENDIKGYRRLTPNQCVGLRHIGFVLEVIEVIKDFNNEVVELICKCTEYYRCLVKPKAFIQWVSKYREIQVRLYSPLFKHKNPEDPTEVPGGFLSDCNTDSLEVLEAYIDLFVPIPKPFQCFQFERNGFFSVDPKSTRNLIFNQTVSLKEDPGK